MTESNDAWEGLSEGTLSKEEEALLRALAEESEGDALKLEAYAPLNDAFKERTVDRLAEQIKSEGQKRWRARVRSYTYVASGFAAAAAALLVLWPKESALPDYTMNVQGSVQEQRGDTKNEGALHMLPESPIELTLTPEAQVSEALTLTVGLVDKDHVYIAHGEAERAQSGAFRLAGTMGELFAAPPGSYTLVAAVAPKPLDGDALRARMEHEPHSVDTRELVLQASP
jgi:hypothetical protein